MITKDWRRIARHVAAVRRSQIVPECRLPRCPCSVTPGHAGVSFRGRWDPSRRRTLPQESVQTVHSNARARETREVYIRPDSLPPPGARRRRPQARPDGYRQTPGPRSGHRTRPDRLCGNGHGASRFRRRKRRCSPFSRSIGHAGLSFKFVHLRTPPTRTRARRIEGSVRHGQEGWGDCWRVSANPA